MTEQTEVSSPESLVAMALHNYHCDDRELRGDIQTLDELDLAERELGRVATVGMDRSIHQSQAHLLLSKSPELRRRLSESGSPRALADPSKPDLLEWWQLVEGSGEWRRGFRVAALREGFRALLQAEPSTEPERPELREALLAIFDAAEARPDIRQIARKALEP